MWASQQTSQFGQPPQVIVDAVVPADRHLSQSGRSRGHRQGLAVMTHVAFGIGNGIVLSGLRRRFGRGSPTEFGIAYGLGLYGVSYSGLLPSVGILPPPAHDDGARQLALVAAHVAYGAVAGQIIDRVRSA